MLREKDKKMNGLISRQEAIKALGKEGLVSAMVVIDHLSSAYPENDKLHPKADPNFNSCFSCVHFEDIDEICVLRKCVHAIAELKECYTER